MADILLFVYGSLKEGYPNFHFNKGHRVGGEFVTAQPYPFYLADGQLPCLLPQPGQGLQVTGQLFEVSPLELAEMDALERVGEPGGYARGAIEVRPAQQPQAPVVRAFAYFQSPARLAGPGPHVGPLAEYTAEHAARLAW